MPAARTHWIFDDSKQVNNVCPGMLGFKVRSPSSPPAIPHIDAQKRCQIRHRYCVEKISVGPEKDIRIATRKVFVLLGVLGNEAQL
ncbi:uncharacterized protein ColSpa_08489 [Colletotrichum spaethianum]|uniref:Uncharacterized protein n=1 Tax=Colletotrichum spaethianum TaxID=700344 RepID=A0AA37P9T8_9PEZI|nr:uncharacterized protein ColSpa_08489 [Colletotrichum spaethianum]GKT48308.1 hypothetical protein ColSpa_08489 [Colletotrichum spaethianum]